MAKVLYDEGRVVGYSAYELYVAQFIKDNPNDQPATEREWLAASLASGASMILIIPSTAEIGTDLTLRAPAGCRLFAPNPLTGMLYLGKVTRLVRNLNDKHSWATDVSSEFANYTHQNLADYAKIQNVKVINPTDESGNIDYSKEFKIQLYIKEKLTSDVKILLTGFTDKAVIQGMGQKIENTSDLNGSQIGPAHFPAESNVNMVLPNLSATKIKCKRIQNIGSVYDINID